MVLFKYFSIDVNMVCLLWKTGDVTVPHAPLRYSIFLHMMHDHVPINKEYNECVFR